LSFLYLVHVAVLELRLACATFTLIFQPSNIIERQNKFNAELQSLGGIVADHLVRRILPTIRWRRGLALAAAWIGPPGLSPT